MNAHRGAGTTRRDFLRSATIAGGSLVLVGAGGLPALANDRTAARESAANGLEVVQADYPRAFFYRQSEWRPRLLTYEEWEDLHLPLNGIMGKVLREERFYWYHPKVLEYFERFKQLHAEKGVFLHLNGGGADPSAVYPYEPRLEPTGFFAGHWLYKPGTRLTEPVAGDAAAVTLPVADPTIFRLNMGRFENRNDDIGIARADSDGTPDWSRAEQVRLVSIDAEAGTITVERGSYGTDPLDWPEVTYLAPHVTGGPWCSGPRCNLLWSYNYATTCPTDEQGRNATDALSDYLARLLAADGPLWFLDGVQFDIHLFSTEISDTDDFGISSDADVDADGIADGGIVDGINVYGLGTVELAQKLRQKMPDKIFNADGQSIRRPFLDLDTTLEHNRSFEYFNGIETEGFQNHNDPEIDGWSEGLNIFEFWKRHRADPGVSYIVYKYHDRILNFARFRLVFSAAMLTDSAMTYTIQPPKPPDRLLGIWDELWKGTERTSNWLGMPTGPAVHLAERSRDILAGSGTAWIPRFVDRFSGSDAHFARRKGSGRPPELAITFDETGAREHTFHLRGVDVPGEDLFLVLQLRSTVRDGYPDTIGRYLRVVATPEGSQEGFESKTWTGPDSFTARFYFRNVGPGPVDLAFHMEDEGEVVFERLTAHAQADAMVRQFDNGAVFANPSDRPYTFEVGELFPGVAYRRIQGSPEQDPETNDGRPLEDRLTIGPRDGLVVTTS